MNVLAHPALPESLFQEIIVWLNIFGGIFAGTTFLLTAWLAFKAAHLSKTQRSLWVVLLGTISLLDFWVGLNYLYAFALDPRHYGLLHGLFRPLMAPLVFLPGLVLLGIVLQGERERKTRQSEMNLLMEELHRISTGG